MTLVAFPRMERPAARTTALRLVGIELLKERRQIGDDAVQLYFDAMEERVAARTIPFEAVDHPRRTLPLDHEPDCPRRSLRRMAQMRRQQEDRSLANRQIARRPFFENAEHHVALKLIEEFLERIVMKVGAVVGTAHHRDDEIALLPDLRVADRRPQQRPMRLDPLRYIEWGRIKAHARSLPECDQRAKGRRHNALSHLLRGQARRCCDPRGQPRGAFRLPCGASRYRRARWRITR